MYFRVSTIVFLPALPNGTFARCSKANPFKWDWPEGSAAFDVYSSRIRTAAAIVVVHSPRLSPTADWVTLLVRTILFEIR